MPWYSFLGIGNNTNGTGSETGYGDSQYDTTHPLLGIKEPLDYKQCLDIYRYWPLGKRIASALPNFALSAPRDIMFDDLPQDFINRFKDIEKEYDVDYLIKKVVIYTRIFGMGGIFISHESKPSNEALSYEDFKKSQISFNLLDPFVMNGTEIGRDPLAPDYQKVKKIIITSQEADLSRCCVLFNGLPFYLQYYPSTYNFATPSIYQNMVGLIYSWNRCVVALERAATKAGSIILKNRSGGTINSFVVSAANKTLELIRNMQNDGIVSIEKDAQLELFNLTGVGEIDQIISQMNNIIMMALSDTPAAILLDKELAQGFGNGEEDMKAILMSVNDFRETMIKPAYDWIDKYLLYLTLTPEFLVEMKEKYSSDFRNKSIEEMREMAIKNFSYEWGNLYPESEATRIDNTGRKLDNLGKLKELGANLADIEQIINNDKDMFLEEIALSEENLESEEGEEGGEEGDTALDTNDPVIGEPKSRQQDTQKDE